MALRFRPMPGLTSAVLFCLPILIGLGIWQYHRWQWKTGVLAEIEAAVTAPPLDGIASLDALPLEAPVDFRRIRIEGEAVGPAWHVYEPLGSIQWRPFRRVVADGTEALVGFRTFDDHEKDTVGLPAMTGSRAGYVRRIHPMGGIAEWIGPDHSPALNRWFAVNPDGAWMAGTDLYVELDPVVTDAAALPVRRPEIANNHVSYMLTWWSFAIILLVIYAMLHHRAGRLSWR
ncbi:SURF1 family cytochrome oxidase biogenesis protein [uncultured Algimonas sp.]|uniref:SURF1 family protein n=1 Tax=uncultured Algimonas sp. TaxID=1547920 RepID=UPI002616E220|nr:SURF1 family cytochrome oxidase biogenesis protein [uncultured Algimonas sp.]